MELVPPLVPWLCLGTGYSPKLRFGNRSDRRPRLSNHYTGRPPATMSPKQSFGK